MAKEGTAVYIYDNCLEELEQVIPPQVEKRRIEGSESRRIQKAADYLVYPLPSGRIEKAGGFLIHPKGTSYRNGNNIDTVASHWPKEGRLDLLVEECEKKKADKPVAIVVYSSLD